MLAEMDVDFMGLDMDQPIHDDDDTDTEGSQEY